MQEDEYQNQNSYWQDILAYMNCILAEGLLQISKSGGDIPDWLSPTDTCRQTEKQINARAVQTKHTVLELPYLFHVFSCNELERMIVYLAILPELDVHYREVYQMMNLLGEPVCTLQLLLELLPQEYGTRQEVRRAVARESILFRYFLNPGDYLAGAERRICLSEFILTFVLEGRHKPAYSWMYRDVYDPDEKPVFPEGSRKIYDRFDSCSTPAVIHIMGEPDIGRKTNIKAYAYQKERMLFVLEQKKAEELDFSQWQSVLWNLKIFDAMLCLECKQTDDISQCLYDRCREAAREGDILFLVSEEREYLKKEIKGLYYYPLELSYLAEEESHSFWIQMGRDYKIPDNVLEELAGSYQFSPGEMKRVFGYADAYRSLNSRQEITKEMLYQACRRTVSHNMRHRADEVRPIYTWEDLILPGSSKEMLSNACNEVKHKIKVLNEWGFAKKSAYGNGVAMVFTGPPGTGKTMAAQVVANMLKMELFKVDLSLIVSKYVGETEKNLKEIFEEAGKSKAILFFDEADVLFGKRTEQKDANDKYNNMEAAFLLQKMEEYRGVSILATNYLQNFDEAFKRRMKYIIDFPFPNEEYRGYLWQSVFPPEAPCSKEIDYPYLARAFELSGSAIKNAAMGAAFLAAEEQSIIEMPHILTAIRNEYKKYGKILSKAEMKEYSFMSGGGRHGV